MRKFKYQVEKGKLLRPISLRFFQKNGTGRFSGEKQAELLMAKLNNVKRVKFAVEESDSAIEIFVSADSLVDD